MRRQTVQLGGGGASGAAHAAAGGHLGTREGCYELPSDRIGLYFALKRIPDWRRVWHTLTEHLRRQR